MLGNINIASNGTLKGIFQVIYNNFARKKDVVELKQNVKNEVVTELSDFNKELANNLKTVNQKVASSVVSLEASTKENAAFADEKAKEISSYAKTVQDILTKAQELQKVTENLQAVIVAAEKQTKDVVTEFTTIRNSLSSAVLYKGSVDSFAELPANAELGWMYNVKTENKEQDIKAGDNVIWNGSSWDNMGGFIDPENLLNGGHNAEFGDVKAKSVTADVFNGQLHGAMDGFTSSWNNAPRNCNDMAGNSIVYYNAGGPDPSIGASTTDGALYSQAYSTDWVGQIAQDYRNGSLFVRGKNNGSWTPWKRIVWNEGTWNINVTGSAGGINTPYPVLATGTEADQVTFQPRIANDANQIVKPLDFQWYDNHWWIGAIRGGNTDTVGFGFTLNGEEKARIDSSGVYHGDITGFGQPRFNNGTWYVVGDDVYMGDFNHGGTLGIKGANDQTGIALCNWQDQDDYALIRYNGGNLTFNKTLEANITGSAGSVHWNNVAGKPGLVLTGAASNITGDNFIDFGSNSTWGAVLRVGGNGHTDDAKASVVTTDGNLHLDAKRGNAMYLNFYSGGRINFGHGASVIDSYIENGVYHGNVAGNANSANCPNGFVCKTDGAGWGAGNTIGAFITGWSGPGGSDIAFRNNGGQLNVVIDGQYYANEGNSLVLNEGNYNNYAPTKNGGGAYGTWNIDINGTATYASVLSGRTDIRYGANDLQYFNTYLTSRGDAHNNGTPTNDWYHIIRMNHPNGTGYFVDLALPFHSEDTAFRRIVGGVDQGWKRILNEGNYNNYAPTKTGGGASGTWGINITGSAGALNGFVNSRDNSPKNCNDMNINGVSYYIAGGPSRELGATTDDGALYSQAHSAPWAAQIAQDYRNGNLFTRGKNNGNWTAWRKVAYSDDKPANAGHADRASIADNAEYISNSYQYMRFHWDGQGGQPPWLWGGSDGANMYVYNPSNFSVNYANSAGNSDTVDGCHEYNFLRYRDAVGGGTDTLWSQIGIRQYNGGWPAGVGDGYTWGAVVSLPAASARLDIWYNHVSSENGDGLAYRSGWDNDKKRWVRILDTGNFTRWAAARDGDTIYTNNWFRSRGQSGWYSEDYGGGWYMTDTTWIRAYNGKSIYTPGTMQCDGNMNCGTLRVAGRAGVTVAGWDGYTLDLEAH